MQDVIAATLVLAGLFFSLVCGLLCEELIFGGLFRLFFRPPRMQRLRAWVTDEDAILTNSRRK
jgi:hypothetical protein